MKWKPGKPCDAAKVFLDLFAHLGKAPSPSPSAPNQHQHQHQLPATVTRYWAIQQASAQFSKISASNSISVNHHSLSFQLIQIALQLIEVVSQSWMDDQTPLVHTDIDEIDVQSHTDIDEIDVQYSY